jgi:hypothetical protein
VADEKVLVVLYQSWYLVISPAALVVLKVTPVSVAAPPVLLDASEKEYISALALFWQILLAAAVLSANVTVTAWLLVAIEIVSTKAKQTAFQLCLKNLEKIPLRFLAAACFSGDSELITRLWGFMKFVKFLIRVCFIYSRCFVCIVVNSLIAKKVL